MRNMELKKYCYVYIELYASKQWVILFPKGDCLNPYMRNTHVLNAA